MMLRCQWRHRGDSRQTTRHCIQLGAGLQFRALLPCCKPQPSGTGMLQSCKILQSFPDGLFNDLLSVCLATWLTAGAVLWGLHS